jgi:hypothetical protein
MVELGTEGTDWVPWGSIAFASGWVKLKRTKQNHPPG